MKLKILNILTVSMVTLAVLAPGIIVFNLVWQRHIELVKTQNLSCQITNINQDSEFLSLQQQSINIPQSPVKNKLSPHNFYAQLKTIVKQYKILTICKWLVLSIPILIGFAVIAYDRYLIYRAAVFKAQVEMLERLWKQSIEQ
ncbi:MAG: hypothetical protein EAZ87_18365 [Nostocales cyanobacterium]|nr:MAG: hypothetical protein EAZ87_18365 [Nostocales cyanobacterium]